MSQRDESSAPSLKSLRRVIKLGGSLLDYPTWADQFRAWRAKQQEAVDLVVVGGGRLVEAVRETDRELALGDEISHWLAIKLMSHQARHVLEILGLTAMENDLNAIRAISRAGLYVADPWPIVRADENADDGGLLPHSWDVTSDSIAARIAQLWPADELVLLKSARPKCDAKDAAALAAAGFVDGHFPRVAAGLSWRVADLRSGG
ncbi:MAG: hypothetical protein HYS13_08900 [Planctomycetia bacterium]|nr:hypothetical protein [Planctomycetia bacterium]